MQNHCYSSTMSVLIAALINIMGLTLAQNGFCPRCTGQIRFEPQITDFVINSSNDTDIKNPTILVDAVWDQPSSCCDVHYLVDIVSSSDHSDVDVDNCSLTMIHTSENNISLTADCDLCVVQVSAIYDDGAVFPGPCHFLNVTSFHTETYDVQKYSDVSIEIIFVSCQQYLTAGPDITPTYQLNGMTLHGSELNQYISRSSLDGKFYFTISNVTEKQILLEYCVLPSEEICGICGNLRRDILLSRSEVTFTNDVPVATTSTYASTDNFTTHSRSFGIQSSLSVLAVLIAASVINIV